MLLARRPSKRDRQHAELVAQRRGGHAALAGVFLRHLAVDQFGADLIPERLHRLPCVALA
jgi:hypothetical protein